MTTLYIVLGAIALMSIVTFFMYMIDKNKAKAGKWRIPEKVLLGLSFLCGALGGYPAMFICHHKTRKWYFHFVNILGLIVTAGVIVGTAYALALI